MQLATPHKVTHIHYEGWADHGTVILSDAVCLCFCLCITLSVFSNELFVVVCNIGVPASLMVWASAGVGDRCMGRIRLLLYIAGTLASSPLFRFLSTALAFFLLSLSLCGRVCVAPACARRQYRIVVAFRSLLARSLIKGKGLTCPFCLYVCIVLVSVGRVY